MWKQNFRYFLCEKSIQQRERAHRLESVRNNETISGGRGVQKPSFVPFKG